MDRRTSGDGCDFTAQPAAKEVAAPVRIEELTQARKELEEAERAIQKGSLEGFGKATEALKKLLGQRQKAK
jgi:hypothetical protein